ncbi:DUF305 domain-containing protein [Loktanella salsilacus]|uniref:DUF305 domain-containing protein n=1 Tax=Loktanella salsilacus TaxID=195913 RepID=UPI003736150F
MTHHRPAATFAALVATVFISAAPANAQSEDHGAMHGTMTMDPGSMGAMNTMMQAMDAIEPTGDADADFLLMMIPHHQSAVDMARASLEEMDDPESVALAELVIESQEAEIETMKAMLSRLGHPVE